ncbi:hypothetical protein M514_06069 [Trichuris suis]|uniref:Uncharacterized protein n=1 Tax=Trichuris suis TaxID=68888 RepID=A0A085NMG4_9BILA|nr:hypothetical protein M514_06069 [Trichuris suis]
MEVFFTESTGLMKKKNFLQRFSELSGLSSSCRQGMDRSIENVIKNEEHIGVLSDDMQIRRQLQNHKVTVEELKKKQREHFDTDFDE